MAILTVCTLYDDGLCEHYVAVVDGMVSDDDRAAMAESLQAEVYKGQEQEEDGRYLYFVEVDLCKSPMDVKDLVNVDGRKAR